MAMMEPHYTGAKIRPPLQKAGIALAWIIGGIAAVAGGWNVLTLISAHDKARMERSYKNCVDRGGVINETPFWYTCTGITQPRR